MADAPLTRERILEAAEEVLRRYGPTKATVVDVARALEVSHGTVYRHFASKAALRDAILRAWLERIDAQLAAVADGPGTPPERLANWLRTLRNCKRAKVVDEPELFATYGALAAEAREVVDEHVAEMTGQLQRILADGMARGDFAETDPVTAALAVFDATVRFHHPAMAYLWQQPGEDAAFESVLDTLLRGLRG
ncbi:TetR family transcriptional regulator [Oleiagrimonas soli]|uniref:AcrR family transcriptional regulator n=1 Tax=Oleiagrimonas soli TaxID=1543381 RepID=A0A099CYA9_9GAMM|nr:TetR family transcriptional regulator [Oleiagrimonas soli]KGI78567.1 TetR family transcriptional regulator [Oleiagrimonas soli]MBB6184149.1 AcrR family transcriptional regulator [Oleiagrimonas soli]